MKIKAKVKNAGRPNSDTETSRSPLLYIYQTTLSGPSLLPKNATLAFFMKDQKCIHCESEHVKCAMQITGILF